MPDLIIKHLVVWGLSVSAATAVANIGVSVALNALAQGILGRQSAGSDLARELSQPQSLPPHRFAYGRNVRIQGSPAPLWVVKDGVLYGCIILNSRPSAGTNFALFLDRRAVGLSGDVLDFGDHETGTVTILEGETQADITHTMRGAPLATEMRAWTNAGPVEIATLGPSGLRVTIDAPAPAGGTVVTWRAIKSADGGFALNPPFSGHVNVWFGRGDQQYPPARILSEVGDLRGINTQKFWATDRWSGRTVLWVRFAAGSNEERADRWPSTPPLIEVQADWSRVWDLRDPAQDPDDPDTWRVSDNQALCLLDALRMSPIARYALAQIRLEDFIEAADVADELVRLKGGGVERRYRVGGLVAFSNTVELADALKPLQVAGAGTLFRAGGQIGYRL